MNQGGVVGWI